ncbi:hypothetical protein [Paenibacillus sp. RC67]|uniref:hypothetical protein n=1 Tax=Paenibacillus sp. RC67 TaxID=3039392 RepID=UPI0024ADBA5E|nr:hypothetical protein [Paenibacillus sp. RC67]
MKKELLIVWLEEKIQQIKDTPVSVVDTKEKQHYLLGSMKTLELIKEQLEQGKFDALD